MDAITFEQLPQAVNEVIHRLENIEQLLKAQKLEPVAQPEKFISIDAACRVVNLAKATIYGLVSAGKIPYMKQGKKLYFSQEALIEWVKSGHKTAKESVETIVDKAIISAAKKKGR